MEFDPATASFSSDPYPVYAECRARGIYRTKQRFWLISRYDDVSAALREERLSVQPSIFSVLHERHQNRFVCADVAQHLLSFMDPPKHTRMRRIVGHALNIHLRDNVLNFEGIAKHHFSLSGDGRVNLVNDFAKPFVAEVISKLVGIPDEDRVACMQYGSSLFRLFAYIPSREILDEVNHDVNLFRNYMSGLLEKRKVSAEKDLISSLTMESGNNLLDDNEIIATSILLYAGGSVNVDALIASGARALFSHPTQLELLLKESGFVAFGS